MIERGELEAALEAVLFVTSDPVPRSRLLEMFDEADREEAARALEDVLGRYAPAAGRGVQAEEVAGGVRLVTRPELNGWLRRYFEVSGSSKLSMAALETLAIIAYRQPATAPEIQELRTVNPSGVLKTLLEKRLVRIAGRKEVVGKPFLYCTTREFLIHFGLKSLKDLPPLEEFEEALALELGEAGAEGSAGDAGEAREGGETLFGDEAGGEDREETLLRQVAELEDDAGDDGHAGDDGDETQEVVVVGGAQGTGRGGVSEQRLQKILARAGIASRRHAEALIADGKVTVNGRVAGLGDKADPERDTVKLDGKRVEPGRPGVYLLLNKPRAVMSTVVDPEGRPTVLELVPPALRKALVPVGRLDFLTEGLILLTDDGELAQRVAHPRYGCGKTYEAKVRGEPKQTDLERLRGGIVLEGRRTAPAKIVRRRSSGPVARRGGGGGGGADEEGGNSWWTVELSEGRTRQIREMFGRIGHPVVKLRRVSIGPIVDRNLPLGMVRELSEREVEALRRATAPGEAGVGGGGAAKTRAKSRVGWAKPKPKPNAKPRSKSADRPRGGDKAAPGRTAGRTAAPTAKTTAPRGAGAKKGGGRGRASTGGGVGGAGGAGRGGPSRRKRGGS